MNKSQLNAVVVTRLLRAPPSVKISIWMFVRNAIRFTPVSKKFWIRLVELTDSTSVSEVVAESNPARLVKPRKYERGANLAPLFFRIF